jgi:hypothetical protein
MSDDDKKATDGTADETNSLKHIGGSQSDAWNEYIGSQALAAISPHWRRGEAGQDKRWLPDYLAPSG